ncbi:hypothetical protein SK128_006568 [Halocaridina rubra]|uniref:Sulfotransferase n=1 Tax=Halocaridina rubra TaxID=373956 RepID=A0AAN9A2E9_HALRR
MVSKITGNILISIITIATVLFYAVLQTYDKVQLQNPTVLQHNQYSDKESKQLQHRNNLKKQVIVWSKVRAGSSFLGELLQRWDYFYSFEPVATFWPEYWENLHSNSSNVDISSVLQFLQDALICRFEDYPDYIRKFYVKKRYDKNPVMGMLCQAQKKQFCGRFELIEALCEGANVHVLKVVRLHLRHAYELLSLQEGQNGSRGDSFHTRRFHNSSDRQINKVNITSEGNRLSLGHVNLANYVNGNDSALNNQFIKVFLKSNTSLHALELQGPKLNESDDQSLRYHSTQKYNSLNIHHHNIIYNRKIVSETTKLNLSIIHLVRDPRGIMDSRRRNPFIQEELKDSQKLCSELKEELMYAAKLKRQFPDNYRLVRYEWLVLDVENASRDLHSWLGLPFTIYAANFIATHSMGFRVDPTITMPFSTFRNSSSNAFQWRKDLEYEIMMNIQNDCKEVLKDLGYRIYGSINDYRNLELTPMLSTTIFDE